MQNNYREEIKTYNDVDIYLTRGIFSGRLKATIYDNGHSPIINFRVFKKFKKAHAVISDDVKCIEIDGKKYSIVGCSVVF